MTPNLIELRRRCIQAHRELDQRRKYTGEHYEIHLGEVAGIATVLWFQFHQNDVPLHVYVAVSWAHDLLEDTKANLSFLLEVTRDWDDADRLKFIEGVDWLTDPDDPQLNREQRLDLQAKRLVQAPDWVKSIKVGDNSSNLWSIAIHDPHFLAVYLPEKRKVVAMIKESGRGFSSLAIIEKIVGDLEQYKGSLENCSECNDGLMVSRPKDIPYVDAKGMIRYVRNMNGYHCTHCAHAVIDLTKIKESGRKIRAVAKTNPHIKFVEATK